MPESLIPTPQVLIVGSVALDSVETPLGKIDNALGGAATYSAVSASFFTRVGIVGVVGHDFPPEHLEFLHARGVDLAGLQTVPGETFRWAGYYDFDINVAHTRETRLGVFQTFKPSIPDAYREAPYVFLANIDPELQLEVLNQVRVPQLTLCDTMNFWIESKREQVLEVFRRVDVVCLNDAEARQLMGTFSLLQAARGIQELGPSTVIIKKGEHGALLFSEGTYFAAPSYPLERITDPTGAGDTFAGGFIGYLGRTGDTSEANLRKAVIYGSVLASFNVEAFSLQRMRRLATGEIAARYREFKRLAFFEAMDDLSLLEEDAAS